MKQEQIRQNVTNKNQWIRLVYMLLFYIILWPVSVILCVIIIVQILFSMILGKPNSNIQQFSKDLVAYLKQILLFLTYSDEGKPFPFAPWGEVDSATIEISTNESCNHPVDEQDADK